MEVDGSAAAAAATDQEEEDDDEEDDNDEDFDAEELDTIPWLWCRQSVAFFELW